MMKQLWGALAFLVIGLAGVLLVAFAQALLSGTFFAGLALLIGNAIIGFFGVIFGWLFFTLLFGYEDPWNLRRESIFAGSAYLAGLVFALVLVFFPWSIEMRSAVTLSVTLCVGFFFAILVRKFAM